MSKGLLIALNAMTMLAVATVQCLAGPWPGISNYPPENETNATNITGSNIKAMGFRSIVELPFYVIELKLSLTSGLYDILDVGIYSNNASNNPGTRLVSFDSVPFVWTSDQTEFTLRPRDTPFGMFRLEPNTIYWVVVRVRGSQTDTFWRASSPSKTPVGPFLHFGARWNGGSGLLPSISSSVLNTYRIRGVIPFTHEGFYMQNPVTGQIGQASFYVGHLIDWRTFPQVVGSAWEVLRFGQFGGTSHADALLRNKATGQLAFWYANGQNFYQFVNIPQIPPSVWQFKGVARFGGALQYPVYQNPQSGVVVVGVHNGSQITQWRIFPKVPSAAWEIVAVGNHTSSPNGLFLFRNKTTGQLAFWRTNGLDFTTWHVLPQVPSSQWDILEILQTHPAGILFQNKSTKEYAVWRLNSAGTALTDWLPLTNQPPSHFEYKGFGLIENFP